MKSDIRLMSVVVLQHFVEELRREKNARVYVNVYAEFC